ncbi:MAG: peptide-methionine (S)-S-oxide reductase [Spirochaetales bacterium]|nr:MAG: peptide-methionine (S)-S-oxide reductase [Spirochaetales bacterium]
MQSENIVLGGGCFWCMEAVFQRISGVESVRPGYAGGDTENPDYRQVCSGETGHAEVVEIVFNPAAISLEGILEVFWKAHNPTTINRQGADTGSQYRSIILYTTPSQKERAEDSIKKLAASGRYSNPPVTTVEQLTQFWPAEDYHRGYFQKNPFQGYCQAVIAPKIRKLEQEKVPWRTEES